MSLSLAGYRIDTVDAGRVWLDGGAMFGIVPKPLWERRIAPDERNRIPLALRCLLLRGRGRTILVDTGAGSTGDDKFQSIYGATDTLVSSLAALEVTPEDVTDVVLTHLHFDHGGGVTMRDGGALVLSFPHATHHVGARQWAWARESPREQASFLAENLDPLAASDRLSLIEDLSEGAVAPGLSFEAVNGHTRGMLLPLLSDGERTLLYAADLLPTAAHVPALWIMAYDVEPLQTLAEKERLLADASDGGWLVVFEHDPEHACARIERTARGFQAADARPDLPESL